MSWSIARSGTIAFLAATIAVADISIGWADWSEQTLKGVRGIESYEIRKANFDDVAARECRLTESLAQAAAVNTLLPMGVPLSFDTNEFHVGIVKISVPTVYLETAGICATALEFRVLRWVIYEWNGEKLTGQVDLFKQTLVMTSPREKHGRHLAENVTDAANEFLALWRAADPSAARVATRQPPPARPASAQSLSLTPAQVSDIQRRLQALQLYQGSVDGKFGPATLSAVRFFQVSRGLPATGEVDWETLQVLFKE